MKATGKLIDGGGAEWEVCETKNTWYFFDRYYNMWKEYPTLGEEMKDWVEVHGYVYIKYDTTPFEGNI